MANNNDEIILSGFDASDLQRSIYNTCDLDTDYDYVVVKTGRQVGKTAICTQVALNWAINNEGFKTGFFLPVYKQCKKVFLDIKNGLRNYPFCNFNQSELTLDFLHNDSRISFFTSENDNCRGNTFHSIICDEACFIKDDIFSAAILPTVAVSLSGSSKYKGKVLLTSTPKTKNWFYDYCTDDRIKNKKVITATSEQGGLLKRDYLLNVKQTTPERIYNNEYLAEFIEAGNGLFPYKNCILDYTPQSLKGCVGSVDWGIENDATVLTIFNHLGEVVCFKRWGGNADVKTATTDFVPIIDDIVKLAKMFGNATLFSETNGIGIMPTKELKKKYSNVKEFHTGSNKQDIITKLMFDFTNGLIKIPNIDALLNELDRYAMTINQSTGKITYGAPNGGHDDCVMSLAIANFNRQTATQRIFVSKY